MLRESEQRYPSDPCAYVCLAGEPCRAPCPCHTHPRLPEEHHDSSTMQEHGVRDKSNEHVPLDMRETAHHGRPDIELETTAYGSSHLGNTISTLRVCGSTSAICSWTTT